MLVVVGAILGAALLLPAGNPALLLPASSTLPRVAAIVACAAEGDSSLPLVGGVPVDTGDALLCRDDESDAWWRATVREVRGNELLVHFTGCDEAWDTWKDAASPDLMPMDRTEQKRDETAFQSDSFESTLSDEDLIDEYRRQRWDDNARWQLTTFAKAQLGSWAGDIELYELDGAGGVRKRVGPWAAQCSSETSKLPLAPKADLPDVQIADALPSVAAEYALDSVLSPAVFRPEEGNMAVAGSYSLASRVAGAEGAWLFDLSISEGDRRVRCKLLYEPQEAAEGEAADAPAMSVAGVAILREARGGAAFIASDDDNDDSAAIDGAPGRGLYDPPIGDKRDYCSLYCEGGVTLVFPTRVDAGGAGSLSLDWIAGRMRYQLDRKFKRLDGSLSSLELTEIQKSDAEKFLPDFPHQNQA